MSQNFPKIFMFYQSKPNGPEWNSAHWNKKKIGAGSGKRDKDDPTGISKYNGGGCKWEFYNNIMNMTGRYPRLYLLDNFKNVECTMYYRKSNKEGKASDGIVFGTRSSFSGHLSNGDHSKTHTYYARIRHDGYCCFAKEQSHSSGYSTWANGNGKKKKIFNEGLPINKWIGMKFICMNISDKEVLLRLYIDRKSNGEPNKLNKASNWELLLEVVDKYGVFPSKNKRAKEFGLDINDIFNTSGMVFIRNGFVTEGKSEYKYVSVREIVNKPQLYAIQPIAPLPSTPIPNIVVDKDTDTESESDYDDRLDDVEKKVNKINKFLKEMTWRK